MKRETISVTGLSCRSCEQAVENALSTIDGVSRAEADHGDDAVTVVADDDVGTDDLRAAVTEAGYDPGP